MAKLDQISIGGTDYDFVPEVAPIFDTTTAYEIGDWVIKDAVLYRFTTAHAAGAWNANQVEEITVGEEVEKALNKTVDVDKTLTIDGAAADSKTVGDELTGLKADLEDLGLSIVDGLLNVTYGEDITEG